ncbi:hypothetical protein DFO78_101134 [Bacillus subtilis]|nr:hypothetical protein DFO78_101134 [Bacillus subtilis]
MNVNIVCVKADALYIYSVHFSKTGGNSLR